MQMSNNKCWGYNTTVQQNSLDIIALQNNDIAIQWDITTIQNDITTIENNDIAIQWDITTIQNDITTIQNDITTIQNDITTIENDITTIEGDLNWKANLAWWNSFIWKQTFWVNWYLTDKQIVNLWSSDTYPLEERWDWSVVYTRLWRMQNNIMYMSQANFFWLDFEFRWNYNFTNTLKVNWQDWTSWRTSFTPSFTQTVTHNMIWYYKQIWKIVFFEAHWQITNKLSASGWIIMNLPVVWTTNHSEIPINWHCLQILQNPVTQSKWQPVVFWWWAYFITWRWTWSLSYSWIANNEFINFAWSYEAA